MSGIMDTEDWNAVDRLATFEMPPIGIVEVRIRDVIVLNFFSIRYIVKLFSISIISIRCIDISIEMISMP